MPVSATNVAPQSLSTKTLDRTAAAAKQTTLNYDNFLKLLLAQMKNQNPTDPMKSTEYMGQLATFSQVEQSVNINSKLDALLTSSTLSQAGNLVGHTVTDLSAEDNNGLLAHLDNGKDVPYEPGMTVS